MRELLLLAIIVSLALVAIIRPKIGVYSLVWFSLMRPDVWAWSHDRYPYALILEVGTLIGSLKYVHEQSGALLRNPIFRLLAILQIPLALSVVLALHPSLCYESYRWYLGSVVSATLIALLIQTEEDFRRLVVIAALSIGYLGARFGLYGLIQGGVRFSGGYGASLSDNNTLALALAMGVPLGWYAKDLIGSAAVRFSLLVSVMLTIAGVVFTYSRGAAIALAAAFLVVILHSRRRILLVAGLAILALPSVYLVKDSYVGRMESLNGAQTAEQDRSVLERMEALRVGARIWEDYPLIGVGFGSDNQRMLWYRYANTSLYRTPLVVHNTYLQMMVDSGIFALLVYVSLLGGAIVMMEISVRRLKRAESPLCACPLAIEAALVTFAVGSTFLTRITFDFAYFLLMMGAAWLIVEPLHLEALEAAREEEEEREASEAGDAELAEAGA
jgi:probable O-glycosylation ligase (exosortase A-associated)